MKKEQIWDVEIEEDFANSSNDKADIELSLITYLFLSSSIQSFTA